MSIAWRTDYATRIMYELARLGPGARASVSVLSADAEVPYDFARQIANRLARKGLLESRRGAQGGFSLARPAGEITILDILDAMDERPTMSLCTQSRHACSRKGFCPTHHGVWLKIDEHITRELTTNTLADAIILGESMRVTAS